ncbi:MAG TPA: hypothetical protein VF595_03190 [Tepidisphaeraceae bacterium]|jgi:hypothetical protein
MPQSNYLEPLEGRRLFSALGAHAPSVRVIGPTGGLAAAAGTPSVASATSPELVTKARRDLTITVAMDLPNGALNFQTLTRTGVRLYEMNADGSRGTQVATGNAQTSGGGDTISLTPNSPLKAFTNYLFEVNASYVTPSTRVKDVTGVAVSAYSLKFKTGSAIAVANPNINFSQEDAGAGINRPYTAVTIGPDRKLYAATMQGDIYRWAIGSDGKLSGRQTITTIKDFNSGQNRIITGITFSPDSIASNLKLYVSHGQYKLGTTPSTGTGVQFQADNYTGTISLLSDPNLGQYDDLIVHIPRSVKDHMNNQIVFDRTGNNFHFVIPSLTAMGAPDTTWGNRPEDALSGAMYRVNVAKMNSELTNSGPIDLDPSASYDVSDSANAVNIYATGIRNAYDMVFHSNGHLYSATNGSSAGGNTPAGGGAPALTNVPITEKDKLLDVKPGKYYGHPNPIRGEYVLDGGNPTANGKDASGNPTGVDPYEFPGDGTRGYAAGVQPDSNWDQPAYDLGKNVSPNGMIEYTGNAFGGLLDGYMLIARYNSGSDIVAVKPNSDGTVSKSNIEVRITGLADLRKPLDLIEDTVNGNLYAVQMPDENQNTGSIVLMKPRAIDPKGVTVTGNSFPDRASYYVAPGNRKGVTRTLELKNDGTTTLVVDVTRTKINGPDRRSFAVLDLGTENISILPGESRTFRVRGTLERGNPGPAYGNLAFVTNEPGRPYTVIKLRAFNVFANTAASSAPAKSVVGPAVVRKIAVTSAFSSTSATLGDPWWLSDLI